MNTKGKIGHKITMLLLVVFLGGTFMFNPSTIAKAVTVQEQPPECIYAYKKHWLFGCTGVITALCKGDSDCPPLPVIEE